jgi:endonuclease/exonuclease/phosphatase (EEP) superfamily protein YafD
VAGSWQKRARAWADICLAAAVWSAIAMAAVLIASQLFGWDGNELLAGMQALTPYVVLLLVPTTALAQLRRRHVAGVTSSVLGVAGLTLLAPIVFTDGPDAARDTQGVDVASVNLLYTNPDVDAVADLLVDRDADVIVFTEYTEGHHARLLDASLASSYPHRVVRPGPEALGVAVWSRLELDVRPGPPTVNHNVDVLVDGPDGPFRLLAVHTPTPVYDFRPWLDDLATIGEAAQGTPSTPTLVIGDFNASYWHPAFRQILDRGFTDAHIATGDGFSSSWPAGGALPAFVRLDHALTGFGLVPTWVDDFPIPGSDHTGFEVTVAPARAAAPGTLARGG